MGNLLNDIKLFDFQLNEDEVNELMNSPEEELSGCGIGCGGSPIDP